VFGTVSFFESKIRTGPLVRNKIHENRLIEDYEEKILTFVGTVRNRIYVFTRIQAVFRARTHTHMSRVYKKEKTVCPGRRLATRITSGSSPVWRRAHADRASTGPRVKVIVKENEKVIFRPARIQSLRLAPIYIHSTRGIVLIPVPRFSSRGNICVHVRRSERRYARRLSGARQKIIASFRGAGEKAYNK